MVKKQKKILISTYLVKNGHGNHKIMFLRQKSQLIASNGSICPQMENCDRLVTNGLKLEIAYCGFEIFLIMTR